MMYSDADDVRNTGDIYRLSVDSEKNFTDSGEMAEVPAMNGSDATGADGGGCDFVSKPLAAPLSSRASAFSIAALMKDRDTNTTNAASSVGGGHHQTDSDARHNAVASLYDIATDGWRQQVRNYSGSAEVVSAKTDADYWATFSNASQRRMYI